MSEQPRYTILFHGIQINYLNDVNINGITGIGTIGIVHMNYDYNLKDIFYIFYFIN